MTTTQSIFVVFFAIFWGAVFNVQGRWKMFQPILSFQHIRHRFLFSLLILNVAPVLFFVWTFFRLKNNPGETLLQLSAGVLSAFAIFAFYIATGRLSSRSRPRHRTAVAPTATRSSARYRRLSRLISSLFPLGPA